MTSMNAAEFWELFRRFSLWTLEVLAHPRIFRLWIICVAGFVLAFALQRPFQGGIWRRSYWLIFTQVLFAPGMIVVGVLFPALGTQPYLKANVVGRFWLDGLFYLSLATACFWVYRMKGLRWLAASLVAMQELVIFCASFVAGMRVRGDWL